MRRRIDERVPIAPCGNATVTETPLDSLPYLTICGVAVAVAGVPLAVAVGSVIAATLRVACGLVSIAAVLMGLVLLDDPAAGAPWQVGAILAHLALLVAFFAIRFAGWRLTTPQAMRSSANAERMERARRVSLSQMLVVVAAFATTLLGHRLLLDHYDKTPVHTPEQLATLACLPIALGSAAIVVSVSWLFSESRYVAGRVALVAGVVVAATVVAEFTGGAMLAIDHQSIRTLQSHKLLTAVGGAWWRWSSSTVAAALVGFATLRWLGLRWIESPYD